MNKKQKRSGFYMNVTVEERKMIEELMNQYAINLSRSFKIFLKQMVEKLKNA